MRPWSCRGWFQLSKLSKLRRGSPGAVHHQRCRRPLDHAEAGALLSASPPLTRASRHVDVVLDMRVHLAERGLEEPLSAVQEPTKDLLSVGAPQPKDAATVGSSGHRSR